MSQLRLSGQRSISLLYIIKKTYLINLFTQQKTGKTSKRISVRSCQLKQLQQTSYSQNVRQSISATHLSKSRVPFTESAIFYPYLDLGLSIQFNQSQPFILRLSIAFIIIMTTAAHGEFLIGNYRVGQTIGEGTFGKVRLGVHIPTESKVAVKTLQKEKIVEQADIQRVTREICILKILRHPNIIQLYEIIESKTDIHLIMEYAPGGELFDYIVKKKRLDQNEAINFMQQILSGVQYIHKNGIVHRDLKPENLLFDEHRNIKIVDFGLSNQYKPGERLKTACGSPCYAAPEMIAGKRYECSRVDIWSCGIILYAMLCGYLPFEDQNTNKLYKKIMSGEYQQPKVLTSESKEMLKHILDVNPETRYTITQIKQTKWYNQTFKKYQANGIIVGTDSIAADMKVIALMKSMGVPAETAQITNYIATNRHNHITAHYYLLKHKTDMNPSLLESVNPNPRSDSPLIFKPQAKKQFYIPKKSTPQTKDNKVNDSFNASTIVSSLVEANKSKIIANANILAKKQKKIETFDKTEEFKLFPKPKTSSTYQPNTSITFALNPMAQSPKPVSLTSRNEQQDKKYNLNSSYKFTHSLIASKPTRSTSQMDQKMKFSETHSINGANQKREQHPKEQEAIKQEQGAKNHQEIQIRQKEQIPGKNKQEVQFKNKRREQLSDQLKQISLKIDKEIQELRKQNNVASTSGQKRRDSFTFGTHPNVKFNKTMEPDLKGLQQQHKSSELGNVMVNDLNMTKKSVILKEEKSEMQSLEVSKINSLKQNVMKFPKIHFGPFNARCLFMQGARVILNKVGDFLKKSNTLFLQTDPFSLRIQTNQTVVSVQSIHGIGGYHLVKFSNYTPICQAIIDFLSQ